MNDLISRSKAWKALDRAGLFEVRQDRHIAQEVIENLQAAEAVLLSDVYRLIAGHSNYHGDAILSALTCITEGKEVKPIKPLESKSNEWVPCSERLPDKEDCLYWTTHEDGSVVLHGYLKENGFIYNWEVDDLDKRARQGQVIAWIPIFEPQSYSTDMRKRVE